MESLSFIFSTLRIVFGFVFSFWWLWLPPALLFGAYEAWLLYREDKYLAGLQWVLLEVTPPPDVPRSPKAMENFFAGLHGIYSSVSKKKKFFEGKVPDWFSLELVGNQGDMKFYIRSLQSYRNLVESQIFAQYPEAEVMVAEDYIDLLPEHLPNEEYELFGTELEFSKDNAFPIKTYPAFEEPTGKDEFRTIDPLAPLAEVLTSLGHGEHIWIQILVSPTGDGWVKAAQPVIDKLGGKKGKPPEGNAVQNTVDNIGKGLDSLMNFALGTEGKEEKKEEKDEFNVQKLTPGQRSVLEQVELKVTKHGFNSGIRFIYISKKDVFNRARVSSVTGVFKQVYANTLNSFKPNMTTMTLSKGVAPWLFPSDRGFGASAEELEKKKKLYRKYRDRDTTKKEIILNTEELATLFHLPGLNVLAPSTPRVGGRKAQPPIELPTR
ncbi:MAG: hypothetical protein KW806_01125 [Candidatus Yanofskybacteria bacterium]|nr:hypothetical protein [Candidatus Yanofskybacteria bacterium]